MRRRDPQAVYPLGIVVIAVVMFFAALGTLTFRIGNHVFGVFERTLPVDPFVSDAFLFPDVLLSLLLIIGAILLIQLKKSGLFVALVALGMWLFDILVVLGLAGRGNIGFLGATLIFVAFSLYYLWNRRDIFD
jgi:hypothetical protein